jgi:MaoC like domain
MPTPELTGVPRLLPAYARAVVQGLPVVGKRAPTDAAIPALTLRLPAYRVERGRLDRYRALCGFERADRVPVTYPHLVAFPLHLALLNDARFPFAAMGLLHVANSITVHGALGLADIWQVTVRPGRLRPHHRGQLFEIVTEVATEHGTLWTERSELLALGPRRSVPRSESEPGLPERAPEGPARWTLPAGLGRRYARVSGDFNPIHLSALTARPFGFRRPIAHGMWTLARSVAAVANRLPDRCTVDAAIRRPIELPGTVRFGAATRAGGLDFGVTSADGGVTHLVGRATPVPAVPEPPPEGG